MNIVIDIRNLNQKQKTGVGEYTVEFLNECLNQDKKNNYFLFYNSFGKENVFQKNWKQENVKFIKTNLPNKLLNFLLFFKIIKLDKFVRQRVEGQNIDYFFLANLNFVNFSKYIKYVVTIHDLSFEIMPKFFCLKRRLWHKFLKAKKVCDLAEKIICPSENTRQDLIEIFKINKDKILVNPLGLAKNFTYNQEVDVYKRYNLPDKFILFLGTIEPRKNILSIIEAFEKNNFYKKGYNLILAGSRGWKNKEIFEKIDNTNGVKYIGYIDNKDKKNFYSKAKLFIYPSFYEGFGLPVLEAMNSKLAVITSNNSSLSEITSDNAFLINPNNVNEISETMQFVIENKNTSQEKIKKAYERSKYFSYKKHVENFLELLNN